MPLLVRRTRVLALLIPFLLLACSAAGQAPVTAAPAAASPAAAAPAAAPAGTWYFAVSGDSRDCGDLIMPKIAQSLDNLQASTPASFYWHLGDFRRGYGPDCDMVKRDHADWNCQTRPENLLPVDQMSTYLFSAWDDFIKEQIDPFGQRPVYLAFGNHETAAGRTRDEMRRKFQKWLTSGPIHLQRLAESSHHFYTDEGDSYFHFIQNGVDFITLDNSAPDSFSAQQLDWLQTVLLADEADPKVTTIVAGMHAALPYSKQRGHAMDASCQGQCSGAQAYALLFRSQTRGKKVYVFASHAHLFVSDLFDQQPEHQGQVLPGWVVGTAGAQQYLQPADPIQYGYALVAVHPDGTLDVDFREVKRTDPPVKTGTGETELAEFCYTQNRRPPSSDENTKSCSCGQALP